MSSGTTATAVVAAGAKAIQAITTAASSITSSTTAAFDIRKVYRDFIHIAKHHDQLFVPSYICLLSV